MAQSRSTLGILTLLVILAVLAGGIWWRLRPPPEDEDRPSAAAEESGEVGEFVQSVTEQFNTELPQPVTGVAAVRDTLWISVTAKGRAAPFREAVLSARASGMVSMVGVRENQEVGASMAVVRVDTTEYALDVAAREAALRKAEVDYRTRVLFDEELDDEAVREQRDLFARAQMGLDQAEVELRRARLQLDKATVRAPFGGRVADLQVVEGQLVREGDELLTVVDIDPVKVEVEVLATEVVHLAEGRAASLEFTAFPGRAFEGRIETINPLVDPQTNTARVTVHIANPDGRIKPGMYAEARLEAQQFPGRILVPRTAIRETTDDRRTFLFVLEDGRAKWRYVSTGMENDYYVEILESGQEVVEPGEVVLVDGHHYLPHDAAVELVDDPEAAGGRPTR